jgi:hypothetical protein
MSLINPLFRRISGNSRSHRIRRRARFSTLATRATQVEVLENRLLLTAVTVTTTADSGPGSLRAAIAAASAGDTINFANQLKGQTITLTSGQISITRSLDIEGPGANKLIVSGNNATRVFDIGSSANVTIAGLTIANGSATSATNPSQQGGGGVLNEVGSIVHLNNDTFSNNTALVVGGALWNQSGPTASGTAIVSGSTFTGNRAIGSAAGTTNPFMLFEGFGPGNGTAEGGAIDNDGSLTVADSTFKNNQALGVPGNDGVNASAHGGAIGADGSLTVSDSTFTANQALGATVPGNFVSSQGLGGGVIVFGNGTITGSTFTGNQAIGGAGGVSPTKFAFVGAGGGLLALGPATLTVSDSSFDHNQAIGGAGGAGGGGDVGIGGGLAVHGPGAHLTLSDSSLSHNDAIGGAGGTGAAGGEGIGGGLSVDRLSTATITDIELTSNQAIGGDGGVGANGGNGWGGGIAVGGRTLYAGPDDDSVTLSGSTISHNQATGGNGGVGGTGGNGSGGGVFIGASQGTFTPRLTVLASTITKNQANGGGEDDGAFGLGVGGGVYNLGTFTFDVFTDISKNHASTSNDDIFP